MKKIAMYTRDQVDAVKVALQTEVNQQEQLLSLKKIIDDLKPLLDKLSQTMQPRELHTLLMKNGIDISLSTFRRLYKRPSKSSSTPETKADRPFANATRGGFAALAQQNRDTRVVDTSKVSKT